MSKEQIQLLERILGYARPTPVEELKPVLEEWPDIVSKINQIIRVLNSLLKNNHG